MDLAAEEFFQSFAFCFVHLQYLPEEGELYG